MSREWQQQHVCLSRYYGVSLAKKCSAIRTLFYTYRPWSLVQYYEASYFSKTIMSGTFSKYRTCKY